MEVTRRAEYAITALIELASQKSGEYLLSKEIASRQNIPEKLIPQIMATLSRKGWVEGARGAGGGVRLVVDPASITVQEVVELMEGPIALNRCLVQDGACMNQECCPLHGVWAKAQQAMVSVLKGTSIGDLVKAKAELVKT